MTVPHTAATGNGAHATVPDGNGHVQQGYASVGQDKRTLRLTAAATIEPRPVTWLWEGRIPAGEITLTPGLAGVGKSTFHAWLIAEVTRGQLPGAHEGHPKAAIICATEDSWERTIVPRLMAADADLGLVYRVEAVEDGKCVIVTLPADIDGLACEIEKEDVALVSLDPLMSMITSSIDTHKDAEVRRALEPLSRLAERTGCSILGNCHFNKGASSDPMMRITGSAAFGQVVRAVLSFAADPDSGNCVISQSKNNYGLLDQPSLAYQIVATEISTAEGPANVGRLEFDGEAARSVQEILGERDGGEDRSALVAATEWLDCILKHGPMSKAEVVKNARYEGISGRTLARARTTLAVVSERDESTSGRPATWKLPDYVPTTMCQDELAYKNQGHSSEVDPSASRTMCQPMPLAHSPPQGQGEERDGQTP